MYDELQAKKKPRGVKDGVWTEDSGVPPPQDIDGGSATRKPKAMAKGGTASSRADGCAQRGKTKGRVV